MSSQGCAYPVVVVGKISCHCSALMGGPMASCASLLIQFRMGLPMPPVSASSRNRRSMGRLTASRTHRSCEGALVSKTHVAAYPHACSDFNDLLSRNFFCPPQLWYTSLPRHGWRDKAHARRQEFLPAEQMVLCTGTSMGAASMSGFAPIRQRLLYTSGNRCISSRQPNTPANVYHN